MTHHGGGRMPQDIPRVLLVAGTTATGEISGISAAGADPGIMALTPSADAEIVAYGEPVRTDVVPVSPTGCPTPAVVTRAVRELHSFPWAVVDAGLTRPTAAGTIDVGATRGADIRNETAVERASQIRQQARGVGAGMPDDHVVLGETIPGGTTTALGVLNALGERATVSSSLPDNPLDKKRAVVDDALAASGINRGDCAGEPMQAIGAVGDPVQAATLGLIEGLVASDTTVTLAGGTQQLTTAALARHAGIEEAIEVATTTFVVDDESTAVSALASDLAVSLTVTDPGFSGSDHVALQRFAAGEAKEGVAMGGVLALADAAGVAMADVREQITAVYERICGTEAGSEAAGTTPPTGEVDSLDGP